MSGAPVRIGVFGGSFDPPHIGHFLCARVAAEHLRLDRVLVIPAAVQPHKPDQPTAPPELRWEMVKAAVVGDELFQPSSIELDRGGISWTVDTLRELARRYPAPEYELYCLIGADALTEIETWRDPDAIFKLARVAVMSRPGAPRPSASQWAEQAQFVQTPLIDLSSTWIRQRVAAGLPVGMMVGAAVEEIILKNGLYRDRDG